MGSSVLSSLLSFEVTASVELFGVCFLTNVTFPCLYPTVNVLFKLKNVVVFTLCVGFLVAAVDTIVVVSALVVVTMGVGGGIVANDK
jgi:hypothetical protein